MEVAWRDWRSSPSTSSLPSSKYWLSWWYRPTYSARRHVVLIGLHSNQAQQANLHDLMGCGPSASSRTLPSVDFPISDWLHLAMFSAEAKISWGDTAEGSRLKYSLEACFESPPYFKGSAHLSFCFGILLIASNKREIWLPLFLGYCQLSPPPPVILFKTLCLCFR